MADLANGSGRGSVSELRRAIREARDVIAFLRSSTDLVARGVVGVGRNFVTTGLKAIGDVVFQPANGQTMLRFGDVGSFGKGFELYRDDGTRAARFGLPFANSLVQALEFRDAYGNITITENALGIGLTRPHLLYTCQPVAATSGTAVVCGPYGFERTTTSATFETLFVYDGKMQNQWLDFKFAAKCSDGTTAGEIQILDLNSGLPLSGFFQPAYLGAIPTGTTSLTVINPTPDQIIIPAISYSVGDQLRLAIQCRRSAGAGSVTLAVPQAIGG